MGRSLVGALTTATWAEGQPLSSTGGGDGVSWGQDASRTNSLNHKDVWNYPSLPLHCSSEKSQFGMRESTVGADEQTPGINHAPTPQRAGANRTVRRSAAHSGLPPTSCGQGPWACHRPPHTLPGPGPPADLLALGVPG